MEVQDKRLFNRILLVASSMVAVVAVLGILAYISISIRGGTIVFPTRYSEIYKSTNYDIVVASGKDGLQAEFILLTQQPDTYVLAAATTGQRQCTVVEDKDYSCLTVTQLGGGAGIVWVTHRDLSTSP